MDGQPVSEGTVTFVSNGGAIREGAIIKQGAFTVNLPTGKYRVELNAQVVKGKKKQMGFEGMEEVNETAELFPAKYNTNSELSEEISGSKSIKFDLKSKN